MAGPSGSTDVVDDGMPVPGGEAMTTTAAVLREAGVGRPYDETRPLTRETLRPDPPGRGELLVRVRAAGLCHSDLSTVDGDRPRPTPMALGHEVEGEVVRLGEGTARAGSASAGGSAVGGGRSPAAGGPGAGADLATGPGFAIGDHVVMAFVPPAVRATRAAGAAPRSASRAPPRTAAARSSPAAGACTTRTGTSTAPSGSRASATTSSSPRAPSCGSSRRCRGTSPRSSAARSSPASAPS